MHGFPLRWLVRYAFRNREASGATKPAAVNKELTAPTNDHAGSFAPNDQPPQPVTPWLEGPHTLVNNHTDQTHDPESSVAIR